MSISYRKLDLTLSADEQTVMLFGQEMATKYFTEVVVVTMLNSVGNDFGKSNAILNALHSVGLNAGDYSKYSREWAHSNAEARKEADRKRIETEQHRERMAAIHATPAEIAKAVAERKQREEEIARKFGEHGHRAAFGC
ncbi:DUF6971 family protein [Erwinia sp. PsM31]|uniref:DUF6971 family protein n=1 Tax=Erwinia sp. PsM31 TaxID=3030535 RepID=UPI00263BB930|nr:hypothetical protein [Erwinia sp. PsM31]MDN4627834.1 hypothetical protein [Erwinia sp. PsM31]